MTPLLQDYTNYVPVAERRLLFLWWVEKRTVPVKYHSILTYYDDEKEPEQNP